jgi:hypothetical protein
LTTGHTNAATNMVASIQMCRDRSLEDWSSR